MRLLWLTENYPPRRGGMAQACDRIVDNLRKSGLVIDLVFFSCTADETRLSERRHGREMVVAVGDSPGHDLNCLYNLLTRPGIRESYDGIVAFGGNLPVLALPVFKAWFKCPAFTLLRGNDFDLGIFVPQRRLALSDAIKASQTVCVLSEELRQRVADFYPGAVIATVPNGIDPDLWHAEAFDQESADAWRAANLDASRVLVGMIGQFKAKKGGLFLLENALRAGFAGDFHFVIIGDVEDPLHEWLEAHQKQLCLSRFPFTDRFELISHYLACDYIALPSHYDGMPNVLLEAGSLGKPVIAARTGGIVEVLPPAMLPLTFHPGDAGECQQALDHARRLNPAQRQSAGLALKTRICNEFNAARETTSYQRIFSSPTKGTTP